VKRLLLFLGGVFLVLLAFTPWQLPANLLLGWSAFLVRVFPRMEVDWATVVVGVVAFLLFTAGLHWIGCAWVGRGQSQLAASGWRLRWSVSVTAGVLLLFAAGVAVVGVFHQVGWLATSKEPMLIYKPDIRGERQYSNLRLCNGSMLDYESAFGSLPPGGTFTAKGEMLHSWETELLPFIAVAADIDKNRPWNDPRNSKVFQTVLVIFLNPALEQSELRNAQGYALSHYAVNGNVLAANRGLRSKDFTNARSTTILVGEVNTDFQPWGHPVNWRDPAEGINRSPRGFGGPRSSGGACFGMADGSVRSISERVSPEVLRALGTPNGGEEVDPAVLQEFKPR
jgi:hypothetical protein